MHKCITHYSENMCLYLHHNLCIYPHKEILDVTISILVVPELSFCFFPIYISSPFESAHKPSSLYILHFYVEVILKDLLQVRESKPHRLFLMTQYFLTGALKALESTQCGCFSPQKINENV